MPALCKREGCDRNSRARGLCPKHYNAWNKSMAKHRPDDGARDPKKFDAIVFAALPGAMVDIMAKTGIGQRTVQTWLRRFRLAGTAHIIDWRRPAKFGDFVPIYGAGAGPDAVCTLVPYCATSESAWKRRKATMSKEDREIFLRKERTRKRLKRAAKVGDPLVRAFFGVRKPSTTPQRENP